MSDRNETSPDDLDPLAQEWPADVLTGEDVVLDEAEFDDTVAAYPDAAVQHPAEPLLDDGDAAPVAEPPRDFPSAMPASDPEPLVPDFPETARVDTATAEDLADPISPLDIDFSAPTRSDIPAEPRDVLVGRSAQPAVSADGQSLTTTAPDDGTIAFETSEAADEVVDTTIIRRSLVAQPEPTQAYATQPGQAPTVSFTPPTAGPLPDSPAFTSSETRAESALLDGATILPTLPGRAGARWLSAIGTLVLAPVAWYLLTDSAVRMVFAADSPWSSGQVNLAALSEMLGGLVVLLLIALLALRSSLGLLLTGIVLTLLGLPFLLAPGQTSDFLTSSLSDPLSGFGTFGQNVYFHVTATGSTGILVIVGVSMVLSSFVTFRLRRIGRAEESLRSEVAAVNPEGLRARWARKATDRRDSRA